MLRREDGQIIPGLVLLTLAVFAMGIVAFNVGKAAVFRSEAQTGADAAALAGARDIKRQLEEQFAATGITNIAAVNQARVFAAMQDYANRNGVVILGHEINGADVKVRVQTKKELGRRARPIDSEHAKGTAKARAQVTLAVLGGGVGGYPVDAGSPGGSGSGGSIPRISEEEWEEFGKTISKPPSCPGDIIALGHLLQDAGFVVGENAAFGPVDMDVHTAGSWHYRCNLSGALDVNFGRPGDNVPEEIAAVDPIIKPLNDLGFHTIWQEEGHYNHLHIDPGAGAGGLLGGGGFTGWLEDQTLDVRLVDYEKPIAPLGLGPSPGTTGSLGPPDPAVAKILCEIAEPYGPKILLATFMTAIVESGVRNLHFGDRDSQGVFQQRPSQGWGTIAQVTNVHYATRKFISVALQMEKQYPGLSAGWLAAYVQRPQENLRGRYEEERGNALALIAKYCK